MPSSLSSFLQEKEFENDKSRIEHYVEKFGDDDGVTARELYNRMGYTGWISTLRARLSDLEKEGRIEKVGERPCKDSDHDLQVNAYGQK